MYSFTLYFFHLVQVLHAEKVLEIYFKQKNLRFRKFGGFFCQITARAGDRQQQQSIFALNGHFGCRAIKTRF
jgi:hypothetical protein